MILNRQRKVSIPLPGLRKFVSRLHRRLGLPGDSFAIAMVSDAEMRRWNRMYRGKNRPTDVLSFPADAHPRQRKQSRCVRSGISPSARASSRSIAPQYLGDVAIAPGVARENARRLGRTLHQELRILILHGILHLMGYDHETDSGQMERRERRLRRELGLD